MSSTPIADHALLSDCHSAALVSREGSVEWLCVPRFDSPSIFGSLLDRQAGSFRLGPFGVAFPTARGYEPGTNSLVTTWKTPTGWILVRDAVIYGWDGWVDVARLGMLVIFALIMWRVAIHAMERKLID